MRYASAATSALLGAALAAVAFGASGGFDLRRTTWTEIAIVLAGALVIALAIVRGRRGTRTGGGLTLGAFAALAALVGLSILWSRAPDNSWLEANLTIAYVVAFATAVAIARLRADAAPIILRALLLAAAAVVVYALGTRVWPTVNEGDIFARLGAPYDYWNALGATAALAVPPALWLGARRSGHAPANALAYPLLALLVVAIFLSYSRAAIIVGGVGALAWVAFVPLRLRSVTVLGVSLAGAAPLVVWALQQDAFTKNAQPLTVRQAVATEFGLFLLATIVLTLGAGLAIGFRVARRPPRAGLRLRLGFLLGAVACAAPIVMFVVLSSSDRGLGGTITHSYESLTNPSAHTSAGPGRLLEASSSRGLYWHQAKQVFESRYLKGTGANTFGVARLRYRKAGDRSVSQNAHGYVHQTAADLGILGLAVTTVLLLVWLVAAGRATGAIRRRRNRPPPHWTADRVGLCALALGAVVYGLHSAVDWIWFVPGPTVMALAAAGFVAGRGPLAPAAVLASQTVVPASDGAEAGADDGTPAEPLPVPVGASAAAPAAVAVAAGPVEPPPPPPPAPSGVAVANGNGHADTEAAARRAVASAAGPVDPDAPTQSLAPPPPPPPPPRRRRVPRPLAVAVRPALALLTIAAALVCAYAIWQPLRSDQQTDRAIDYAADGKFPQALAAVDRAHDYDPLTPRPYIVRSSVEDAAGQPDAARRTLEEAVRKFPGDPQTWIQLASYQLNSLNHPADALAIIRAALFLDPRSRVAQTVFLQAWAQLHPRPAAPAPAPTPPQTSPTPQPKVTAPKPKPKPKPKARVPKPQGTTPKPRQPVTPPPSGTRGAPNSFGRPAPRRDPLSGGGH